MFCKHCGNQLSDTAAFCPACGAQIKRRTQNDNTENQIEKNNEQRIEKEQPGKSGPRKGHKKAVLGIAVIVALAGIAITAVLILNNQKSGLSDQVSTYQETPENYTVSNVTDTTSSAYDSDSDNTTADITATTVDTTAETTVDVAADTTVDTTVDTATDTSINTIQEESTANTDESGNPVTTQTTSSAMQDVSYAYDEAAHGGAEQEYANGTLRYKTGAVLDLGHERTYGATLRFNWTMYYEGYYGFKITTTGTKASCKAYIHTPNTYVKSVELTDENGKSLQSYTAPKVEPGNGETVVVDFSGRPDGLYYIDSVWFNKTAGKDNHLNTPLCVKDGVVYTCMVNTDNVYDAYAAKDRWEKLFADADPKNYLSNDKITYPTSGTAGRVTHVKEWEAKSEELITNPDWTDEFKVFVFAQYLGKNYAYDDYRAFTLNGRFRADEYNKEHPGEDGYTHNDLYMYYNGVGVCWDYTNALTIMCRHYGIPCTSADNDKHTIAAVWLNGKWVPIDITLVNNYECYTKDVNPKYWKVNNQVRREGWGIYPKTMFNTHDQQIWTRNIALDV